MMVILHFLILQTYPYNTFYNDNDNIVTQSGEILAFMIILSEPELQIPSTQGNFFRKQLSQIQQTDTFKMLGT